MAILTASLHVKRNGEFPETFAAKRWVPWLMAYAGARVGEMAQLRKEDLHTHGNTVWYVTVTPEAGTVKTNEARDVVLHPHLVEMGFVDFVKSAPRGHLFLRPADDGDVLGPLQASRTGLRSLHARWCQIKASRRTTVGGIASSQSALGRVSSVVCLT